MPRTWQINDYLKYIEKIVEQMKNSFKYIREHTTNEEIIEICNDMEEL